jgi:DNA-binding FrmR family transcriptional regulator
VKKRLRRIEGQARGVEKMLEEGRDCREILQQLAAIKSAVQQASVTVARSYACQCLAEANESRSQEQIVDELLTVLSKT